MDTGTSRKKDQTDLKKLDILLIGKTGHGKSSTGNTILGSETFQVADSSTSETFVTQSAECVRLDYKIKVVDTPGQCETRIDESISADKVEKDMEKGIAEFPKGIHVLVLVLKYGDRFTNEELRVVQMLKTLFGESFVKDHGIIVFTHGDNFAKNNKRNPNRTFVDWCKEQKEELQSLLQEFDNKVVLFDNFNQGKSETQLQELIKMINEMKTQGKRYTNEIFKKVADERKRKKIQADIELLTGGLEKLERCSELS